MQTGLTIAMSVVPVALAIALAVVIVVSVNSAPAVCLGAITAPAYAAAALGASRAYVRPLSAQSQ